MFERLRQNSIWVFLAAEVALYLSILLAGFGRFPAIVLCFLFALLQKPKSLITTALFFTVLADLCLVVWNPVQRLWGMVFFCVVQVLYAICLHRGKVLLYIRLILTVVAEIITVLVLRKDTDALALVSLFYYANLIMNLICAFLANHKRMGVAFMFFLFCDTVIGLQVMGSLYLPIPEGSFLHVLFNPGFDLSWFFYLPSQVLLSLQNKQTR